MIRKRKLGHPVEPHSLCSISSVVSKFRMALHEKGILHVNQKVIDICRVLRDMQYHGLLEFILLEDNELPNVEAECRGTFIRIRGSVYLDAAQGGRRSVFTIAHEIAHSILHCEQAPSAYGFQANPSHPIYCDSEWQADTFAGLFLVPTYQLTNRITAAQIYEQYSISMEAAITRLRVYDEERKRAALRRL